MKDKDFLEKLRSLRVSPPTSEAREKAFERAVIAFRNRPQENEVRPRSWIPWGAATAALLALLLFGPWLQFPSEQSPAANDDLLVELNRFYDGRLEAAVERDGQLDVVLADENLLPSDQPLEIVFSRDNEVVKVLSYSGREVCLTLDGRQACFEFLLEEDGQVIVVGEDFLWSREQSTGVSGYHIRARALSPTS